MIQGIQIQAITNGFIVGHQPVNNIRVLQGHEQQTQQPVAHYCANADDVAEYIRDLLASSK